MSLLAQVTHKRVKAPASLQPECDVDGLHFPVPDMHCCPERGISLGIDKIVLLPCKWEILSVLHCSLCLNGLKHREPNSAYSSCNFVDSILSLLELLLF